MKTNYTREDLMNPKHVVFCANEEEWNVMNSIVGFKVTPEYYGPYCYSPWERNYSPYSSRTDSDAYKADKILTLMYLTEEEKMVRTISAEDGLRIIKAACYSWADRLAEMWGKDIVLGYKIDISEDFYKRMRGACTADQNKLFDEIFKDDFKPGDWVIVIKGKPGAYKPNVGEVFQIDGLCYVSDCVTFETCKCVHIDRIRKATEEEIRIAQLPKDGEPCWVRDWENAPWRFLYANGKGEFYAYQQKSGKSHKWKYWMKFDPNNLPVLEQE